MSIALERFLFYCVIDDAFGTLVVSLDWSGGLGPSHGDEGVAQCATILSIVKEGADFGFGGRGEDIAHDVADNVMSSKLTQSGPRGTGNSMSSMPSASSPAITSVWGIISIPKRVSRIKIFGM
jgi:hypothetical protein